MFAHCEGHGILEYRGLNYVCTAVIYNDIDFINLYISYFIIKFRFWVRYFYEFLITNVNERIEVLIYICLVCYNQFKDKLSLHC